MNEGRIYLVGTPQEIFGKAEMLKQIGLQLPQLTELLIELKESGFPVRTDIVRMKDALKQVIALVGKNKG
jgi:hypothetical protein